MEEARGSCRSSINGDFGFGSGSDRRFAFSRQSSFQQREQPHTPIVIDSVKPFLSRTDSSIDIPYPPVYRYDKFCESIKGSSFLWFFFELFRNARSGHRHMKRLLLMISLNVAYSTAELLIGLFTGRVGLVFDAFHLTFGWGLLTFSLFVMDVSRRKPDREYIYGYKRLEVLAAFTNATAVSFVYVILHSS